MKKALLILSIISLSTSIFLTAINREYQAYKRIQEDLAYYKSNYLCKVGWSATFGPYDLRSFDAGKTWYAAKLVDDGRLIILGNAEGKFPGLVASLDGLDKLIAYAQKHGPIDPGKITAEQAAFVEDAGFSIQKQR